MLKPLTFSLGLAFALGASSVSMAGIFGHGGDCDTCGIASPQGVVASPQGSVIPSAQSYEGGCGDACDTGHKKCKLFSGFKHKPKAYSYTWVLKKKRIWHHKQESCGVETCDTCTSVYPSGQYASPQAYPTSQTYSSGQAYSAPQTYGSGQATATSAPAGDLSPAPAGDEAPPAPEVPGSATPAANGPQSSLLFSTPAGN